MLQDNSITGNKLVENTIGIRELNSSFLDSLTFDDSQFVNITGDTMTGDLTVQDTVNAVHFRSSTNPSFVLTPSGASRLNFVIGSRFLSPGTTDFYLNPADLSILNNLRVNSFQISGQNIDDRYVLEGQSNSITNAMLRDNIITSQKIVQNSIGIRELDMAILDSRYVLEGQSNSITNAMIQNNAVTSQKIADNSVRLQELDTQSVDTRYVNRAGDSMTGNLNLGGNNLEGINNVRANAFVYISDIRMKENIEEVSQEFSQDILNKLNITQYNYIDSSTLEIGLIAQEVEKFLPSIVFETEDGYLGVDYVRLIPILVNIIQTQQQQIDENSQRINELAELYEELIKN